MTIQKQGQVVLGEYLQIDFTDTNSTNLKEVEMLRTGEVHTDEWGVINVTQELLETFIRNFEAGVRGAEVAIDYDHKKLRRDASGWLKKLMLSDDKTKLIGLIDWTTEAAQKIKEKAYKYFSASWAPSFLDTKTGKRYENVFLGGGICNDPMIKGMRIIQASEYCYDTNGDNRQTDYKETETMDKNQMIFELSEKHGVDVKKLTEDSEKLKNVTIELSEAKTKLTEQEAKVIELTEKATKLEAAAFDMKYSALVKQAMEAGKITKAEADGSFKKIAETQGIEFAEKNLSERTITVKTDNKGTGEPVKQIDPLDELMELAEARSKKDKISLSEAYGLTCDENPELTKKTKQTEEEK